MSMRVYDAVVFRCVDGEVQFLIRNKGIGFETCECYNQNRRRPVFSILRNNISTGLGKVMSAFDFKGYNLYHLGKTVRPPSEVCLLEMRHLLDTDQWFVPFDTFEKYWLILETKPVESDCDPGFFWGSEEELCRDNYALDLLDMILVPSLTYAIKYLSLPRTL
jgi:hypothetical protein